MSLDATKTNQTIKGPDSRTYAELTGRFIRSATIALLEISELKSMWPQCAAVIPDRVASAAIILGPWHMDAPEAMADLFFESIESSRFWAAA